jgi:hypothetical protein
MYKAVLWIRIRIFLGLPDLHPDPLATNTNTDPAPVPDPSIIKQKRKKTLDFYCFGLLYDFFIFEE